MGIVTTHIVQGDQVAMQNAVVEFAKKFSNRDNFNLAVEELAKECRDQNQYDMSELVYKTVKDTLPNSTHRDGGIWWAVASITSDIAVGNDSEAELAVDSLIADFNDHPELAQGVLEIGLKYYRKGRLLLGTDNDKEVKNYYRKAINVWERIIYRLPRSAVTARACYVTAVCYSQELGEYITGIGYFQMIVNNWPDYQYAWHAQYFVGMYYSKLRNMGVLTAEKADPLIENAYKGVLEKYPESKSAVSAALNLATMSSSKGLLHDAANYYEIYLKKETNDNNLSKALKKVYGLGQRAEKEGAFSNAMELYGLVTVFARDIDDSLVSKARDRAAKSLEAIESSLILKKVQ